MVSTCTLHTKGAEYLILLMSTYALNAADQITITRNVQMTLNVRFVRVIMIQGNVKV